MYNSEMIEAWKQKELARLPVSKKLAIQQLEEKIKSLKSSIRITAMNLEQRQTLLDGTVIVIQAEDEKWVGKQITYEDGSQVPAGAYELASGMHSPGGTLIVDEDSTVLEVRPALSSKSTKPVNFIGLPKPVNGFDRFLTHIFDRYQ